MPANPQTGVGKRVAYYRSVARPKMTQQQLAAAACVSLGTVRKIERGERGVTDSTLEAIADALGVDPVRLLSERSTTHTAVHTQLPVLSAALAVCDIPEDGPVRPLHELRTAVASTVTWRLAAQYTRIARHLPGLLAELARAHHVTTSSGRSEPAALLVTASRSADAVAYKFGARDLSARLVDLMRWAAPAADDPLLSASVAYVRTETFFAARAHGPGLRALEQALDAAPAPVGASSIAVRGALHMRAAVIAGRARNASAAATHLDEARALTDRVREDVYYGTAFGPDSVRIHEVSVAVSLGDEHVGRALGIADEWTPPGDLPAERRSGFYIELNTVALAPGAAAEAVLEEADVGADGVVLGLPGVLSGVGSVLAGGVLAGAGLDALTAVGG